jgi:transposase
MYTTLFSLPTTVLLEDLQIESHLLTLVLGSTLTQVPCPVCDQPSSRIHSRYMRTLADLPCQGRAVRLQVQVRRFFCDVPACSCKTFAEQFPLLAPAYARRTSRQAESLRSIASALGGRAGMRLVKRLSMPTSRFTLVRLIRQAPTPPRRTPRVLGVDDFAWKKGDRYGTLLVDLQAHRVVDVLPDREAETFVTWLKAHPGVQVIARDRAGNYADGARRGAPKAIQVGDRFHLLLNLTTALQRFFERKQERLQRLAAQEKAARMPEPSSEPPAVADPTASRGSPLTVTEAQRQGRRARRKHRYDEVIKLHQQGASQVAIATLVGLHRDTVRRYINAASFPEIVRPGKRSKLDPYKAYLRERWAAGQHNSKQLLAELREQGYRQGETIVYDYLRSMRERPEWREAYTSTKKQQAHSTSQSDLSAREAAWLFACNPQKLRLTQVFKLDHVRRSEEELEIAYQLAQDFRVMVTRQQEANLGRWLKEVQDSGIAELRSLAAGILRDFDAVRAALTLPYSSGQTEGQVNKLKTIKRQMYGRADFDLLRQRVLSAA